MRCAEFLTQNRQRWLRYFFFYFLSYALQRVRVNSSIILLYSKMSAGCCPMPSWMGYKSLQKREHFKVEKRILNRDCRVFSKKHKMPCKTSLWKDTCCFYRLTQGKVQWDQMEESPRNENSNVCSKGVSDPRFRAFEDFARETVDIAVKQSAQCLILFWGIPMHSAVATGLGTAALLVCCFLSKTSCISPATTEHTIRSHTTSIAIWQLNLIFFLNFYSPHGGLLLRNLQKWAVLKTTLDAFCKNKTTLRKPPFPWLLVKCDSSLDQQREIQDNLSTYFSGQYTVSSSLPHKNQGI